MKEPLTEDQMDRETYRSIILTFAGFSFAGALGIVGIAATLAPNSSQQLQPSLYYLLTSFLLHLLALNIQGYKLYRILDQLTDYLVEAGVLLLLFSIIALVRVANPNSDYAFWVSVLALGGWLLNHAVRVFLTALVLINRSNKRKKGTKPT
jgi:hypothetical protein